MAILKVNGSIVRVGGKLVKYPAEQTWYAVRMRHYPEGEWMGYPTYENGNPYDYISAVTTLSQKEYNYSGVSWQETRAEIDYSVSDHLRGALVCTHGVNYKDPLWDYVREPYGIFRAFSSRAAAIAYGTAKTGLPEIPNIWDSIGAMWGIAGFSPVTPWVRHMYKETVKNWEWWSDGSNGYVQETVSLVCVNEPQVGWSTQTSHQDSVEYEVEEGVFVTVYYGTMYCYEYLGLMGFSDGVAEIGGSIDTLQEISTRGYYDFSAQISDNWYMPNAPLGTTCPSPASHCVLTGHLRFIDSRGCALAPILECPVTTPASAAYTIYDANENSIASGSLSLNGDGGFSIRLNPNLASSIDTIKLSLTLDESDRTFNSFTYKVNSVKINNTPTLKLNGTYDYSMEIPSNGSIGTIEVFRRYIIKTDDES